MTTWQFWIAVTRETGIAVTCETGTVTPIAHITHAITPINTLGTARAAATAPPIEGSAEDRPFTYSRPRRS
jgi:hypothetical protein